MNVVKNGEAETEEEVAETKEVVEEKTEEVVPEVVSTNGTEAKEEEVVEAKNGEAETTKDEDKNGDENRKELAIFRLPLRSSLIILILFVTETQLDPWHT